MRREASRIGRKTMSGSRIASGIRGKPPGRASNAPSSASVQIAASHTVNGIAIASQIRTRRFDSNPARDRPIHKPKRIRAWITGRVTARETGTLVGLIQAVTV